MTDENLYSYLDRRERELQHQISAFKSEIETLRGHLAQREYELAQITHFRASQTIAGGAGIANRGEVTAGMGVGVSLGVAVVSGTPLPLQMAERLEKMTIKQLVVQALLDHFPTGANATLIRDFIRDAYGKVIQPSSLRPQLHRLKADGVLTHDTSADLWNLTAEKRKQYRLYNHPSSEKMRTELLTDEPSEPTTYAEGLREYLPNPAATKFPWADDAPETADKKGFDNPPFRKPKLDDFLG